MASEQLSPFLFSSTSSTAKKSERFRPNAQWSRWKLEDGPDGRRLRQVFDKLRSREKELVEHSEGRRRPDTRRRAGMRIPMQEAGAEETHEGGKKLRKDLKKLAAHPDHRMGMRQACHLAVQAHREGVGSDGVRAAFDLSRSLAAGLPPFEQVIRLRRLASIQHQLHRPILEVIKTMDAAHQVAGRINDNYLRAKALCDLAESYAAYHLAKAARCLDEASLAMGGQTPYLQALLEVRTGEIYYRIGEREMVVMALVDAADHAFLIENLAIRQATLKTVDKACYEMGQVLRLRLLAGQHIPPQWGEY